MNGSARQIKTLFLDDVSRRCFSVQTTRQTLAMRRSLDGVVQAFQIVPAWNVWQFRQPTSSCAANGTEKVTVKYRGQTLSATQGERLRDVLLRADRPLHNGGRLITCRGLGTCGTCAVAIAEGEVTPTDISWRERARLNLPPHAAAGSLERGLRLACQVRVVGNVDVRKFQGFWGQNSAEVDDR